MQKKNFSENQTFCFENQNFLLLSYHKFYILEQFFRGCSELFSLFISINLGVYYYLIQVKISFLKGVNQAIELELLLTLTQISEGIFHPKVLLKLNFGN